MTSQAAGGGLGCQGGVIHGLKHDDRQPSNRLNKSLRVLLKGGSQCRTAGGIKLSLVHGVRNRQIHRPRHLVDENKPPLN